MFLGALSFLYGRLRVRRACDARGQVVRNDATTEDFSWIKVRAAEGALHRKVIACRRPSGCPLQRPLQRPLRRWQRPAAGR